MSKRHPQSKGDIKLDIDRIIVVVGPTGTGKSQFIQKATRGKDAMVGHSLRSYTSNIQEIRVQHPSKGYPVVFIDTPGFDDTYRSDMDVLSLIADWLVKTYKENTKIAGIIYLHRISDNRISQSLLRSFVTFGALCGQDALLNVIVATTMWSAAVERLGAERERELEEDFLRDILNGCRTSRFQNTHGSAWEIADNILGKKPSPDLVIQLQMADGEKLQDTQIAKDNLRKTRSKVPRGLLAKIRGFFSGKG